MKATIHDVQKIFREIEKASDCGDKVRLQKLLDDMIVECQRMKTEIDEKKKILGDIEISYINSIPFIYKPVLKKNYYEGNYLEEFSAMRTSELKEAKSLDIHNKFWQTHEILRGNIFGSVPKDLINKEAVARLERYGWDEVTVEIYEINKRDCTMKDMVEFCELRYAKFLMVKEKSTGAELILHYNI